MSRKVADMHYQSVDQQNVRQIEKTKRARLICGTVTSSLFILSCAAVAISGQWAKFAEGRREQVEEEEKR